MTPSDLPLSDMTTGASALPGLRRHDHTSAVTVDDVARAAGVSAATVSRAMRNLPNVAEPTRARVHSIADQLGYRPDPQAARLASGKTATVGVAVPLLGQWYFSQVVAGMHERLASAGYDLLLFSVGDQAALDNFIENAYYRKRIDALALFDIPLTDSHIAKLETNGVTVVVSGGTPQRRFSAVSIDDYQSSRVATAHLIGFGHRRIAFMGEQPLDMLYSPVAQRRRHGFIDEMAANDIEVDESLLVAGRFCVDGGEAAGFELLSRPDRPTAIVCASDEMAIGVLAAARHLNLAVPGQLSVIGFDDHDMAAAFGLSTIAQSVREQGLAVAELVLESISGADTREEVRTTRLIERETVGPVAS